MFFSPMSYALEQAKHAGRRGEIPVGAVVLYKGAVIAAAGNDTYAHYDPTAHAEIQALRLACRSLKSIRLPQCDLYVTLEPCAMCAAAISFTRIRRLYYALADAKGGAVEHGPRFFTQPTCHHRPEIYSGLAEEESKALLQNFFKQRR